ncbi:hypothetical protein WJX81_000131 [Elliptochloris bilobata]|uniref:Erythromycin esterase n=1 Tax=Elliptochloris bilobata TaxID=381761 RepID=A0AAW1R2K8_9CHLO
MVQVERSTGPVIKQHAFPATPQSVLKHIPESCDFVLIGEASHGTHEFYSVWAEVTKLLIQQRQLNAVALEADFPDAFKTNLWVRGLSDEKDANAALSAFKCFPQWMWRNRPGEALVTWLRSHNLGLPEAERTKYAARDYGMERQCTWRSAAASVRWRRPFAAVCNARVVKGAETYYRNMFFPGGGQ